MHAALRRAACTARVSDEDWTSTAALPVSSGVAARVLLCPYSSMPRSLRSPDRRVRHFSKPLVTPSGAGSPRKRSNESGCQVLGMRVDQRPPAVVDQETVEVEVDVDAAPRQ